MCVYANGTIVQVESHPCDSKQQSMGDRSEGFEGDLMEMNQGYGDVGEFINNGCEGRVRQWDLDESWCAIAYSLYSNEPVLL